MEHLLDEEPEKTANKLMHADNIIDWLLTMLEKGNPSSENFLSSAEVLFALIQSAHQVILNTVIR